MAVGTGSPARRLPRPPAAAMVQVKVWSRVLGTAAGIGALAGAAQLGMAYGLGLVRFARTFPDGGLWSTQLTWTAWFAALAVLAGATAGSWTLRQTRPVTSGRPAVDIGQRVAVAVLAAIGAGVTVGLTALPASNAQVPGANPATEVTLAATLGLAAGVLIAVAALSLRVVAVSVTAVVAVGWLVALVSVAPSLGPTAQLPMVRLGVLDLPGLGGGATIAVLSPPLIALLVGGAVATAAGTRNLPALDIVLAGVSGPALLLVPYLIAAPGQGERALQAPAFGGAMVGAAAGVLAATVVILVRLLRERGTASPPLVPPPLPPVAGMPWSPPTGAGTAEASPAATSLPETPPGEWGGPPEPLEPIEPADRNAEPAPPPVADAPAEAWPSNRARSPEPPAPTGKPAPWPARASQSWPSTPSTPPVPPAAGPISPAPAREPEPEPAPIPPPPVTPPAAAAPSAAAPAAETPAAETPPPAPKPTPPASVPPVSKPAATQAPTFPPDPPKPVPPPPAAPPAEPTPAEPPPAAAPPAAEQPAPPSTPAKKRGRRRHEEEHVDWVRSLAGDDDEPADEADTGKRRLRLDKDLFSDTDPSAFDAPLPSARPSPAAEDDDTAPRPRLPRPYVTGENDRG